MPTFGDLIKQGIELVKGKSLNLFQTDAEIQFDSVTALTGEKGLTEATGARAVKTIVTEVDASAGGTAQTTACGTVPANSLILNVQAHVTEAFDGDTTTTLEVGITGNIDKYIDTTDFDPSATAGTNTGSLNGTTNDQKTVELALAAVPVIATWTNATPAVGTGKVKVYVSYIDL